MERALLLKPPASGVSAPEGLGAASGFGSRPGLGLTETRLSTIVPPDPFAAGGAAPEPGRGRNRFPLVLVG